MVGREIDIAKAMAEQKKRGKAITAFEAVLQNDPYGPLADDAEMGIGRCYLESCKYVKAKKSFETVVENYQYIEEQKEKTVDMEVEDASTNTE